MAASQLVTLGIGTPGGIPEFLLLGLVPVPAGTPWETLTVAADPRTLDVGAGTQALAVEADARTAAVGAEGRTLVVPADPRME